MSTQPLLHCSSGSLHFFLHLRIELCVGQGHVSFHLQHHPLLGATKRFRNDSAGDPKRCKTMYRSSDPKKGRLQQICWGGRLIALRRYMNHQKLILENTNQLRWGGWNGTSKSGYINPVLGTWQKQSDLRLTSGIPHLLECIMSQPWSCPL